MIPEQLLGAFPGIVQAGFLLLISTVLIFILIKSTTKYQTTFDKGVKTFIGTSNPLPKGGTDK